ncbi:alpha/beta hydrolase family protein [Phormidium tenue]|uniref:Peptidase S9 prolyl oligopeptidase catalytic domain-containing protein n=1 Tax=Phormidium tenue NIES-30 TaxID=549789 RepID=A0A1U7IYB8_9CYAN|nr:prolyl oligopeptidase family serine peptidase [Phormidium tenue]OKH43454.1 hypothetical protein NIES30_24910 [Phormidium tenue NIES-30]
MEPTVQHVEFTSATSNVLLRGRFVLPSSPSWNLPLVIMLTGDGPKGTKSLSWANMPPRLCSYGIASFLFDFEGLGYSEGERSKLTVSRGIDNFKAAFTLARSQGWVDTERIGIFAASFGATVALLQPDIVNQAKLVGLKSPASFLADAYANECSVGELDKWIKDGFSSELGYDIEVLQDALRHNVYSCTQKIHSKTLISHGNNDEIVPFHQSKFLLATLQGEKHLEVFPNVGHNYSEEGAWEKMASLFISWFHNGFVMPNN